MGHALINNIMYHFQNTSDQREKPVYKSHIALALECTNETKCAYYLSIRYILYRTLSLVSAFQKIVTMRMKLPLLYRCTNAISIVGFSFLNFLYVVEK